MAALGSPIYSLRAFTGETCLFCSAEDWVTSRGVISTTLTGHQSVG
jgi:hypothetical protein